MPWRLAYCPSNCEARLAEPACHLNVVLVRGHAAPSTYRLPNIRFRVQGEEAKAAVWRVGTGIAHMKELRCGDAPLEIRQ